MAKTKKGIARGKLLFFLLGAVTFLCGFFPFSYDQLKTIPKYAGRPTYLDGIRLVQPMRKHEKYIFMIVDALRTDFPTSTNMPFAYSSSCTHLNIRVDIPTVTMPRIKSLMTGSLSGFIDVILNLGHVEQLDDSLLHRLKRRGDVIVFAGDRTWTNLFPSEFNRKMPNMDSFFVNDFSEGDKNVTLSVKEELGRDDWTLLILHYLGLDHIGHVEGSESSKIYPKLNEMDEVIRIMHESKKPNNKMIILTADHGMRNGGGHGGSTKEELNVPLLIFKENCTKDVKESEGYNQIDITPTLSILLCVEIPKSSIGCIIPEFLEDTPLRDQLYAFYYNSEHLLEKTYHKFGEDNVKHTEYFNWMQLAKEAHKDFLSQETYKGITNTTLFQKAKLYYMRCSRSMSSLLSESLVKFDNQSIVIGLLLTSSITIQCIMLINIKASPKGQLKSFLISLVIALCISVCMNYIGSLTFLTAVCFQSISNIIRMMPEFMLTLYQLIKTRRLYHFPLLLISCYAFYIFSLGSSSYIEYEQKTWYFWGTSIILVLSFQYQQSSSVLLDSKSLNTHDIIYILWKLMGYPLSIGSVLGNFRILNQDYTWIRPEYKISRSVLLVIGLISLQILLYRLKSSSKETFFTIISLLLIYCFRGVDKSVHIFAVQNFRSEFFIYGFWITICAVVILRYKSFIESKSNITLRNKQLKLLQGQLTVILLISALLHKPQNVILLPAMLYLLEHTFNLCDSLPKSKPEARYLLMQKTLLTICISKMFYFYQGNTNSLATIDLNPGYIGQSTYNPLLVGIFLTLNTFSAPIIAFLYLVMHVLGAPRDDVLAANRLLDYEGLIASEDLDRVQTYYKIFTMIPTAVYMCLMVIFRYHLFIYSVFAPKVFYEVYNFWVYFLIDLFVFLTLKIIK